jgi:cytochrome c-type biogenesis protein CcmH/NrfG
MGQDKDVIRVLRPAQQKHPDDLAIAYLLGTAYIRDKQVEPGQVLVDHILRNGDSAEAHLMMGSAKMNVADFAGARDEFAKAVALNPDLPQVHVLYAQALQLTGDSDQSLKQFKAELAVDPFNFESNLQIGAMLRQEQNYDEAIQYFARLLRPDQAIRQCATN